MFDRDEVTIQKQKEVIGMLEGRVLHLEKSIKSVPEFIPYPWDWKRCLFCKGNRKHKDGCIRQSLQKK